MSIKVFFTFEGTGYLNLIGEFNAVPSLEYLAGVVTGYEMTTYLKGEPQPVAVLAFDYADDKKVKVLDVAVSDLPRVRQ